MQEAVGLFVWNVKTEFLTEHYKIFIVQMSVDLNF
jgi:hypothetical protein